MDLTLTRIATGSPVAPGVLGILHGLSTPLFVVEREWLGNRPGVSCVPPGRYSLEPHDSDKYPATFALVGDTVSHYPEPGKPRSACVFHVANYPTDLQGCLAPNLIAYLHPLHGGKSGPAVERLLTLLNSEPGEHTLEITDPYELTT